MLAMNMRQLKHKTLTKMGVAQSLFDPSFEALSISFHRIEESLPHVYHHILTSLTSCHACCSTLGTTFQHIPSSTPERGDPFTRTMQRVREQADALEQAVSLTVLAPVQALMQRCAVLRTKLHDREKYVINYDLCKLEFASAAATDPLKPQKQEKMEQAWQEYQSYMHVIVQDILQLEEDHVNVRAEALDAMKLHVAKFFLGCQKQLWSALDVPPPATDLVVDSDSEDDASWRSRAASTTHSMRSLAKQFSSVDGDAISPRQLSHLVAPVDVGAPSPSYVAEVVSAPMSALPLSPRSKARSVGTMSPVPQRQSWFLDFLWSQERPTTPKSPLKAKSKRNHMALAPMEWAAVEDVLWELDEKSVPPLEAQVDLSSFPLPLTPSLVVTMCSYLDVVSLAQLAQTCHVARRQLLGSTALWHRVIRLGGVPSSCRCSFWVWFQYKRRDPSFHARVSYDQLLRSAAQLVRVNSMSSGQSCDGSDSHEDASFDDGMDRADQQILAWFNDIDVDVNRTCHKTLFTKDVAEEWDLVQIPETDVAAMVEHALSSPRRDVEQTEEDRNAMHATMRRLLRAYVMFNPDIGYCQGMNFVVRLLLDNQKDEATVFWAFVNLCDAAPTQSLYEPGFHTLHVLFGKLEVLVQQQMPDVYNHFITQGVAVSMFAARWFLTLFTSLETFGPTLVLRVLDLYHLDRHRILCGIAVVVLEELKDVILESEFETILAILQYPRHYMPEPDFGKRKELLQHALVVSITRILLN
ncbi:hypothetical protein H310_05453 [Aphanomyces invadans]|uniref:Rab-GAP TBC domain-containing protein n=1 Tax=Aphanomyces invadans TaxID=157072 RepID=A0A024U9D0_9STRA|nr:hypothetical protein H310_05453 [Aphanomyces invadans]ETW03021.1 hypothetical protein H310_05453 [Aphanomyces invadans]|eukprot:XP_008868405.1 hypothetical protein H310_05453 [Aphanomyces invadans]